MAEDRPNKPTDKGGQEVSHDKQPKREGKPQQTQQIVRLVETNIDGGRPVRTAIQSIKGVSFMFSNAVSRVSGLGDRKLADLKEGELKNLEDIILNPAKHGIPAWMFNRKRDPFSGSDSHLSVSTLDFTNKMDIDRMKKFKSYRGVRHIHHLPVRGQRTRGSFRRSGKAVGVSKKKARK
jgi:small subunit ribosomal protein S13